MVETILVVVTLIAAVLSIIVSVKQLSKKRK